MRTSRAVDLSARRELNRGFGDALSMAVELAVTPALFAFLGWQLDNWLGTAPLFLLVLFVFTISYEIWKLFMRYDAKMRREEARVTGLGKREGPQP
ncbi:MAG: AtpZ/AtpI family protein [Acidimicrobiales bacterium]